MSTDPERVAFGMMMFPERHGLKEEWFLLEENEDPRMEWTWIDYWENGDKEVAVKMFKEMYGY